MRYCSNLIFSLTGLIIFGVVHAGDIYDIPEQDLPFAKTQYDETINIEVNVYGNSLETIELEETITDDVHPYVERNMQTKAVRTRIIENDFVSVHVLRTSPTQLGTFTEDLFTGNASEDIQEALSSIESVDGNN